MSIVIDAMPCNVMIETKEYRAAPIPGICIGIKPIPAFLMVLESVKYVI